MADKYVKKTFYIPKAVALAIEAMAQKDSRSASSLVTLILKQAINERK